MPLTHPNAHDGLDIEGKLSIRAAELGLTATRGNARVAATDNVCLVGELIELNERSRTRRCMGPGAGSKLLEILVGVVVALVLAALPFVIWRAAVLAPYRAARLRLERLAREVRGLRLMNANTDLLDEPGLFTFTAPWPIARGQRGAFEVELVTQQGFRYDRPYTMVNVSAPGRTGPALGATNAFTFRHLHALALNPLLLSARSALEPAGRRTLQTEWMGEGVAWGPPQAFERFFDERARELLGDFPRELSYVSFDGRGTVSVLWYEVEGEAAVVERAFRLGAELLEHGLQTGALR